MSENQKNTEIAQEAALDEMFAAARTADPVPSGDLMARILADAKAVQGEVQTSAPVAPERSRWQGLNEMFGGWAGVSTLAACVGLGVIIGFVSPDAVMAYVPGAEVALSDEAFGLYFESEL